MKYLFPKTGNNLEEIAGITIISGASAVIDLTTDSYIIPGATNIIKEGTWDIVY